MTIEEKAKAWDLALDKAKEWKAGLAGNGNLETCINELFPQLAESEDEKIRKEIVTFLDLHLGTSIPPAFSASCISKWITWLKKQGECPNKVLVSKELYEHIRNTCACIDDAMSSETLVDARDYLEQADESAKNAFEMIEKQGEQKPYAMWNNTKIVQAPSEKDILGWYRKSSGELDDSPKIVWFSSDKEAVNESTPSPSVNGYHLAYWAELPNEEFKKKYWYDEQKPVEWSEIDEENITCIEFAIKHVYESKEHVENLCNWLQSLRPQKQWKPTEEQMRILQYLCEESSHPNPEVIPTLESLYNDLKAL